MNYLSGSNKKKTKSVFEIWSILIVVVVATILLLSSSFLYDTFRGLWIVQTNVQELAVNEDFLLKSKIDLSKEISRLKQENDSLRIESLSIKAKSEEYDSLVGNNINSESLGIKAKVIKRPPYSSFDTLVIDRGTDDGVVLGASVDYRGAFAGVVKKVFNKTSIVYLPTSPGEVFDVEFAITEKQARAEGVGNGVFVVSVPSDTIVENEDIIHGVDRDLKIVGIVKYVDQEFGKTLKKVFAHIPWDIDDMDWVTIINK